jgi:hypothetical protein
MNEADRFNAAMSTILRANPKAVKAAVDAKIQLHTAERKARGEQKRGRKANVISSSGRASNAKS